MDDRFDFEREAGATTGAHQRTENRDSMFLQARLVRDAGPDVNLRVRNLSAGGMMAETDQVFVVGESLRLELRTIGIVDARIAWVAPPRIGIAFDRPVDPKLARKKPLQSPGSSMLLVSKVTDAKRPGVSTR